MSVLVKGMKMPENCDVCLFSDWSNLSQTASCKLKEYEPCFADFSNEYKNKRSDFCPLAALPDKHGRLVDADALNFSSMLDSIDQGIAEETVMEVPTIVEAEDNE